VANRLEEQRADLTAPAGPAASPAPPATSPPPPVVPPALPALPAAIFRRWKHSREEDTDGVEVYRPEGFPFPPSFERDGFEIRPDGRFIQADPGPADGIVRVPGHWMLFGPRRVAVSFSRSAAGRPGFTFQILDLDETVLHIHRITRHVEPLMGDEAADPAPLQPSSAGSPPSEFRLVAYVDAKVLTLKTFPAQYILEVSGYKPFESMVVDLAPAVYVQQPDFWEIDVVGSSPDGGLPWKIPYTVSKPLGGALGACGIEVIGANKRERFDLSCSQRSPAE